ncbi:hypothetical protein GCM10027416_10650 [Okibacterium endophyticum]
MSLSLTANGVADPAPMFSAGGIGQELDTAARGLDAPFALSEHVDELTVVDRGRVAAAVRTYRGEGLAFL